MPCICYGAVSGKEELDSFLKTEEGKKAHALILEASIIIKKHKIHPECINSSFYNAWIECFDHMIKSCKEKKNGSFPTS